MLRDRVTVQSVTATSDTQGGRAVVWGTLATVWASVVPMRAGEVLAAEALGSHADYRVEMQYRTDVTASMRLSWTPYSATAAKTLEIHGVQMVDGTPTRLQLSCGEVV